MMLRSSHASCLALLALYACGGEVTSGPSPTSDSATGFGGSKTGSDASVGTGSRGSTGSGTSGSAGGCSEGPTQIGDGDIARFGVSCGCVAMTRYTCASTRWTFSSPCAMDAGTKTVVITNYGPYPIAYIARQWWNSDDSYVPGHFTNGEAGELYGVLQPGAQLDISAAYSHDGGIFALIASVRPFETAAETAPLSDEGKIPWSAGQLGGVPATELFVAQLTERFAGSECDAWPAYF